MDTPPNAPRRGGVHSKSVSRRPAAPPAGQATLDRQGAIERLTRSTFPPDTRGGERVAALVPELVAARAVEHPDRVAVVTENEVLGYGELDRRAEDLARRLVSRGVGPDSLVGLLAESSAEMVVGALGIMKAGGAYLPMDPSFPKRRLSFMLKDARATTVVAQRHLTDLIPNHDSTLITVGGPVDLDRRSTSPLARPTPLTQDHLAYVVYTSGSVGEPKGVEVTHRNLLHLLSWHWSNFTVNAEDRASHLAAPGFDATVWELWPYLTMGASIHIPDPLTRVDPARLLEWFVKEMITISFVPTALVEDLLTLPWPGGGRMRFLLTGGDTLHRFPPADSPFVLVNNYGPTETTVVATSGVVAPQTGGQSVPGIGRPIDGTSTYIVDENLQPVGPGNTGQLLIGGEGVAKGYLSRAELTAAKFIVDPFTHGSKSRLYITGDLVRARPDGELEFVGRIDDQVKIRGYRIELGEIEVALTACPGVQSGAVAIDELSDGEKRLVAYLVPDGAASQDSQAVRRELQQRLPAYMIPAQFSWVTHLPVTSNGKTDRLALRNLGSVLPGPVTAGSAPGDDVELALVQMIAELLRLAAVGIDENFFTLGGHSLLAAQVIARVRQRFGVELPLRYLFDKPTIRDMALEVRRLLRADIENMTDEEATRLAHQLEAE